MPVQTLFPTLVYYEPLKRHRLMKLNEELKTECYQIRDFDDEGRRWSNKNYSGGYTSYASMAELFRFSSTFEYLKTQIDRHVARYAKALNMDVKNHPLTMTNLWVNIVPKFTYHGLHLHPLSTISGTYYVDVPKRSGAIKLEDPRLSKMMGSIPRVKKMSRASERFHYIQPSVGQVLLFESWLRHEVMQNLSDEDRVSISFNYHWT